MCRVEISKYVRCGHTITHPVGHCGNSNICSAFSRVNLIRTVMQPGILCHTCFDKAEFKYNRINMWKGPTIMENHVLRSQGRQTAVNQNIYREGVSAGNTTMDNVCARQPVMAETTGQEKNIVAAFTRRDMFDEGFLIVDKEDAEDLEDWDFVYMKDVEDHDYYLV
ncbi:hypothetical protein RUND412_004299 [Rhizina undulata]